MLYKTGDIVTTKASIESKSTGIIPDPSEATSHYETVSRTNTVFTGKSNPPSYIVKCTRCRITRMTKRAELLGWLQEHDEMHLKGRF